MENQAAQKKSSVASGKGQPAPFFGKAAVQTKLTVNAPGDRYEQEADAVADQVMRMTADPVLEPAFFQSSPFTVQRQVPSPDAEARPREGTAGDVVEAVVAIPEVSMFLTDIGNDFLYDAGLAWDNSLMNKFGFIGGGLGMAGGLGLAIYAARNDPDALDLMFSPLSGTVIPAFDFDIFPGVLRSFALEANFDRYDKNGSARNIMGALHFDVGRLLPPMLGFGPVNEWQPIGAPPIQRKCAHCEEEEKKKLQRKPLKNDADPVIQRSSKESRTAGPQIASSLQSSKGTGRPLPDHTRSWMESRFGTDFSNVSIHTDAKSVQLNRELNAQAFTHGRDIYFNKGKFDPDTDGGKRLLAHELTHVIQQDGGIHRSCSDGKCEDCAEGWKTIRVTVFFRRRAARETMRILREKINEAKRILKACCINLYFDFNWRLLNGPDDFDPGRARPHGDANGAWDYPNDAETLGEGNTFSGARGIPMLVVDNVPRTGGGVSVMTPYDSQYSANPYIVIPIEHGRTRSIAHELGHVAGILAHPATGVMSADGSSVVNASYCASMRALAT